jgi:hypothetical protein
MAYGNPDDEGNLGIKVPSAVVGFQQTIGTSETTLTAAVLTSGATLKADDDNDGSIYLGKQTGLTSGNALYRLKAGQSVFVSIDNLNKFYGLGSVAGQKLYAIGS